MKPPGRGGAGRRSRAGLAAFLLVLLLPGCGWLRRGEPLPEPAERLAVLPLEAANLPADEGESVAMVTPEQADAVTAQIYGVFVDSPRWRFVPDLDVTDALRRIPASGSRTERAKALGRRVRADAVLTGTVSRFRERDGRELGARAPASVAFELELVSTTSGAILWRGHFDKTQQPLSSNLLNFWMFWRSGPRFVDAAGLARLGMERVLDDLSRRLPP